MRYGITTSKKIGCAVERNRAKRVIRSAFSQIEDRLNGNYDIVFIARTKTSKVKMQQVLEQMEKQFKGCLLAAWRILRCNPFSKGGWDPVPPKKTKEDK